MTKKDYELIALGLEIAKPSWIIAPDHLQDDTSYKIGRGHAWDNTCRTLSELLEREQPRFDKQKFLAACGIQD